LIFAIGFFVLSVFSSYGFITTHDHSLCMYAEKSIIQVRSVSLLFILRAKLLISTNNGYLHARI